MKETIFASRKWIGANGIGTVTAELGQFAGQQPYFSLTYSLPDSGGAGHDTCVALAPECAPFVKWHLVGTDAPMHYVANALYWAGVESYTDGNGLKAFRRSKWCDRPSSPGSSNPPNWEHFASTIVLGSLDTDPTLDSLRAEWDGMVSPGAAIHTFVTERLQNLQAAFRQAMLACFPNDHEGVSKAFAWSDVAKG